MSSSPLHEQPKEQLKRTWSRYTLHKNLNCHAETPQLDDTQEGYARCLHEERGYKPSTTTASGEAQNRAQRPQKCLRKAQSDSIRSCKVVSSAA